MKIIRNKNKSSAAVATAPPWKVLIVDDEEDIHAMTRLALNDFKFVGRKLEIFQAMSGIEAREILATEREIAAAFIDVVMETDDAGLQLVDFIRNELKYPLIRLILRTGQPGLAPEHKVIEEYDIDDYKDKSMLTAGKLYTAMRLALKSYSDIKERAELSQTLEQKVKERTAQLLKANEEITSLNEQLKSENIHLSAELNVSHQLQQMLLPKSSELSQIKDLDIAGFMEAADEVGGDYYDVLQYQGRILIAIGDVTGHGLESGALALMVQSAMRTLLVSHEKINSINFLNALNQMVYHNVLRMDSDKNLTLSLLDYQDGQLTISGQHEEIIVVRNGELETIDTTDLGMPIGLVDKNLAEFTHNAQVNLNQGDVVVLFTDGITEAANVENIEYGLNRLCNMVKQNWQKTAEEIQQSIIENVRSFIGTQKVFDDITLVVLKQQ
jgi:serine phosphatase RsbU (regulator of sigma subunit)